MIDAVKRATFNVSLRSLSC